MAFERIIHRYTAYYAGWCVAFGEHEIDVDQEREIHWIFGEGKAGITLAPGLRRRFVRELLGHHGKVPEITLYEDAARIYEVALALDDSHYHIWGNLGSSYQWVPGCREKSLAAYREAIRRAEEERKITPNNGDLLCFLAGYYAELGESQKALELTERALELASDEPVVMFQAGHTYEVLGYREKALEWLGRALEHGYSPEQVETTPALAELRKDERYRRLIERTGVTS